MPLTTVNPGLLDSQAQYTGFKNRIINGACSINQRGSSLATNNTYGYYVDRMWGFSGSGTAATYSQISSTGLAGFPYAIRAQRNAANTGTAGVYTGQIVESNNLQDLQGQSVTLSFWARAGSNYSSTGNALAVVFRTGTTADQGLAATISPGWAGQVDQTASVTLTTSWQYFSKTFTVASNVQEITPFFYSGPTGTAGANDYFDITGVQLEKGSTATSFDYRPYGTELQLCQRYYYKLKDSNGAVTQFVAVGYLDSANAARGTIPFPVTMRIAPTALEQSGTPSDYAVNSAPGAATSTSVPIFYSSSVGVGSVQFNSTTSLTVGQGCMLAFNTINSYLAWSAEL